MSFSRCVRMSEAGCPTVKRRGLVDTLTLPPMVIKCQTLKDPSSFPPFTTLISVARSFSPHLPGEKGLLAHWYTEMALAQN